MNTRIMRFCNVSLLLAAVYLALPAAVLAAEEGGNKWGILLPIGRVFNLGLVIFVLVLVARKPLKEFYESRTLSIHEQLSEAQRAREQAEAKLADMEARMARLDDELSVLKTAAEKEAQAEYQRLVAEAERDAEKIMDRARQEIDGMTRAANIELKAHAAELAVRLAEEKVRAEITDEDRNRLFGRFVKQLGGKA
jgi:F0F1-type ATP synthase membrane subunit b/b'